MGDFRQELAAKVAVLPDVAKVYPWEPGSKTAPIPKSVSAPASPAAVGRAATSVGRAVSGRVIGAAGGLAGGSLGSILLDATTAGAESDKVPPPSARQIEDAVPRAKGGRVKAGGHPMKNVDNSGMTKMKMGCK